MRDSHVARILIAASPEPGAILQRVLFGHDLFYALTIVEAQEQLERQTFDQIVCTILFDESRMFDLLRLAKSKRQWKRIPFVCTRMRSTSVDSPIGLEGVAIASKALGAAAFLNIAEYKIDPEREMREALELLIGDLRL